MVLKIILCNTEHGPVHKYSIGVFNMFCFCGDMGRVLQTFPLNLPNAIRGREHRAQGWEDRGGQKRRRKCGKRRKEEARSFLSKGAATANGNRL